MTTIVPKGEVIEVTLRRREGRPVVVGAITGIAGFYLGDVLAVSISHCYDLNCIPVALAGGGAGAVG